MAKKGKRDNRDKREKRGKGKRGKLPRRRRALEQQTTYDTAVNTLGRIVCLYAILTFLGIVLAVVLGVLGIT